MNARISKKPYLTRPEEARDIAKRFSEEIKKELGILVKSVVLFGSFTKTRFTSGKKPLIGEQKTGKINAQEDHLRDEILFSSDIDVLIVFDDLVNVLNPEVITAYRVVVENTASKISKRLHITTMQLTKFWEYCRKGDPILINMLREGETMLDTGVFSMAKKMLNTDEIRPTSETIKVYLANGPMSLMTAKWNIRQAVHDLYWSVMDAAHAALLKINVVPDTPKEIVGLFEKELVKKKLIEKKHLYTLAEFHNTGRMLMRGEIQKIYGDHYDRYRREAEEFIKAVKEMIYSRGE